MYNIIVVGIGNYYAKTLAPVLAQLQKEGFLNAVVTIDRVERRPCVLWPRSVIVGENLGFH